MIHAQRSEVFEQVVAETACVLRDPAVVTNLGDRAEELAVAAESSFMPMRALGNVILPVECKDDALGLYPLLPTDLRTVRYVLKDWVLPEDRRRVPARLNDLWRETPSLQMPRTTRKVFGIKDSDDVLATRPFIVLTPRLATMADIGVKAAIIAHELDHGLRYGEDTHKNTDKLALGNAPKIITELEVAAYGVTAAVLSTFNNPPISREELQARIPLLDPGVAGSWLHALVHDAKSPYFKTSPERIHVLSLGVGILAEEFGAASEAGIEALTAARVVAASIQPNSGIERL